MGQWVIGMKFGMRTWGGCEMVITYLNFLISLFLVYLSILFYFYITTGIEKIAGLIGMKFGMSIGMTVEWLLHNYILNCHLFKFYVSTFTICA